MEKKLFTTLPFFLWPSTCHVSQGSRLAKKSQACSAVEPRSWWGKRRRAASRALQQHIDTWAARARVSTIAAQGP